MALVSLLTLAVGLLGLVASAAAQTVLHTLDSPNSQEHAGFGSSIAVGDVNGDGKADITVGAYHEDVGDIGVQGRTYAFSGADGSLLLTLDTPNPEALAEFGYSLAVGDVDRDGNADVAVAAPGESVEDNLSHGRAYVFSLAPPAAGATPPPSPTPTPTASPTLTPTPTLPPTPTATPTLTPAPTPTPPCGFNPAFSADVSETPTPTPGPIPPPMLTPEPTPTLTPGTPGTNADVITNFQILAPDYNFEFESLVTFTPPQFWVAADTDIPDGAYVADLNTLSTLGLLNHPCITALPVGFTMLDCTTDRADIVSFQDGFADANNNGLPDACDKYPDFLNTMFPGITPRARMLGPSSVAGVPVSLNMLVFEPETALPGLPAFDASLGYPSIFVLNDPTAPPNPGQPITNLSDFCTPIEITTTMFGVSNDNPGTEADESGFVVRANPSIPGQYVFTAYVRSLPDADGDCIENDLDSCPYDPNVGDPRVAGSGDDDMDGIDNVCDPEPDVANPDQDRDFYLNRGDNCPLVPNGRKQDNQADADGDGIGDACDLNPDTPDGESIPVTLEAAVDISGPPTPTPPVTATPMIIATPAAVPAGGLGAQAADAQTCWPLPLLAAAGLLMANALAMCLRR